MIGLSPRRHRLTAAVGGAVALTVSLTSAAHADLAPRPADAVGVGSDTVQNIMNFVADGDTAGDLGYNNAGNTNRLASFDATPDANDRAGYANGSTNASLKALNPTIVLRSGQSPVQRPNGSGAGISALLADKGSPASINFVRASRLFTSAENSSAQSNLGTSLHAVKIATDDLRIAVAKNATNAPAALTASQLVAIYQCSSTTWNQVGGTATSTIIPLLPQSGSGTRSTFLADLKAANGNTDVTLGSCVQTVEENDPASITGSSSPADTIAPFSSGRQALYDSGYFKDPSVKFGATPVALTSGVTLLAGTGSYVNTRNLYIIFRDSDATSSTPFQPGGTKNLVQTLFLAAAGQSAPFVNSSSGRAVIAAAGVTPSYKDCGAGSTTC